MCPFVIAGDPKLFDRGPGSALAGAGRRVTETAEHLSKLKLAQEIEERRAAEADRRLDIAEMNAKARVLKESNALQEKEAAKTAAMADFQQFAGKQVGGAHARGIREAMKEGTPILGPYGMLNPKAIAQSTARAAETAMQMKEHVELAKRMSPDDARGYLTRETAKVKEKTRLRGFDDETEALDKALQDGAFEPKELQAAWKPGQEPSEQAVAAAGEIGKLLATARAQGKDPGDTTKRIGEAYNLQRQIKARMVGWEKADVKATEMLGALQQLVEAMPEDKFDLETGKSMRQEMTERLAKAEAEWQGTTPPSFRVETDAKASLAALQEILFEAEAQGDPKAALARSERAQTLREVKGRGMIGDPSGEAGALAHYQGSGGPQAAPGAGETAEAPPAAAGAPPPAAKRGLGKKQDEVQLRRFVTDNALKALRAGRPLKEGIAELLQAVARDLGMNPNDPEVEAIVIDQLRRIPGRPVEDARPAKEETARGPDGR